MKAIRCRLCWSGGEGGAGAGEGSRAGERRRYGRRQEGRRETAAEPAARAGQHAAGQDGRVPARDVRPAHRGRRRVLLQQIRESVQLFSFPRARLSWLLVVNC